MLENCVKCFLVAAEYKSFSAAAEHMFLSRQAVSRQILKLEKQVGHPLFERGHNELKLTYTGELCRNLFLDYESKWEHLMHQISVLAQPEIPHISISVANGIDIWRLLNPSVQEVLKSRSFEVDIVYHSPEFLQEDINSSKQSIYITFRLGDERMVPNRFRVATISHVNMVLAVGKNHPLCKTALSAVDFASAPMVTWYRRYDTEESCIRKCMEDSRGLGLSPHKVLVYPNMESAHAAVEFCKGVSLCSEVSKLVSSEAIRYYPLKKGADLVCMYDENMLIPESKELIEHLTNIG